MSAWGGLFPHSGKKTSQSPDLGDSLKVLAEQLREEGPPLSAHVVDPVEEPFFGPLAAAGPRTASAPGEYSPVVEAVREGYLLHYAESRLLAGHDADLALLAGDFLYALGIRRLAALGDTEAVGELAELIADCAQLHGEGRESEVGSRWHAAAEAIGGAEKGAASHPRGQH